MFKTRVALNLEYLSPLAGLSQFYLTLTPRLTPWATFYRTLQGLLICRPFQGLHFFKLPNR
jgi:putative methionine-R-sulfoxide reductase with GAF domain